MNYKQLAFNLLIGTTISLSIHQAIKLLTLEGFISITTTFLTYHYYRTKIQPTLDYHIETCRTAGRELAQEWKRGNYQWTTNQTPSSPSATPNPEPKNTATNNDTPGKKQPTNS